MRSRFSIAALVLFALAACGVEAEANPCKLRVAHVFVDTDAHTLWLCDGRASVASFEIRLGSGGVGKRKEGDQKVPLGEYSLAQPRASKRYGTFILVGYPTAAQRKKGYTGGAIGIHGPHRELEWLGGLNNLFDTTDGCIGVGSDAEMATIGAWLRESRASRVVIR